jgi:hypothetical protein
VAFLTLGSLWAANRQVAVVLGTLYFLSILALVLSALLTPEVGDVAKGLQRSHRLLGGHVPFWHDLTSMNFMVPILASLAVAPAIIGALALPPPPQVDAWLPWPPIVVAFFSILSFGFGRQALPLALGKRWVSMFAIFILVVWVMPVAFGGIADALGNHDAGMYAMLVSPLLGIVGSSRLIFPDADETAMLLLSIATPVLFALLFFAVLIVGKKRVVQAVEEEQKHHSHKPKEVA